MKFMIGMVFSWQGKDGEIEGVLKEIGESILVINKSYQGKSKDMVVSKNSWQDKIEQGIVKKIRINDIVFTQFGDQLKLKI